MKHSVPWHEVGEQFGEQFAKGKTPGENFKMPLKFKAPSKRTLIILILVALIIIVAAYWWFHPTLNIHSEDLWAFIGVFIMLPAFFIFYTMAKVYKNGAGKKLADPKKAKQYKRLAYIPVLFLGIVLVGAILSASFIPGNAARYANVLQTAEQDFTQDMQEVVYSEIPVIDRDSAALLGNRTMGTMADYVSQFEISSLYSQINYQSKPVRVSPLGYADIFKWLTNRAAGIPAYVLVDMATQDTQIVRLEQGIKYSQSEPFARNIDRYVQLKYPFYMFDQIAFEIDEEGTPWWVCPVQTRTIGLFGGKTISRVVLCNASTGECQDIEVGECPQWVDRAYPADLLIQQYNWSGLYVNGWINSWLGQNGVIQTTPGTDGQLGYNYIAKDDDVWVYTGVTSATADNSIIGFVLINQRTAQSTFYAIAGATEESAMGSAEGQVQHLGYQATFPLLINISGQPTYFMALKDAAGLVKMYAMIDIQRYQNVAVGDTVVECQKNYEALLATNGVLTQEDINESLSVVDTKEVTGVIETIAQAVIDGNSHFYIKLVDNASVYDCALPSLIDIVLYKAGDTITLHYEDVESTTLYSVTAIGKIVPEEKLPTS